MSIYDPPTSRNPPQSHKNSSPKQKEFKMEDVIEKPIGHEKNIELTNLDPMPEIILTGKKSKLKQTENGDTEKKRATTPSSSGEDNRIPTKDNTKKKLNNFKKAKGKIGRPKKEKLMQDSTAKKAERKPVTLDRFFQRGGKN